MKITDIRMDNYRWNRAKPIRNGRYVYPTANLNVINVQTDEGINGIGLTTGVIGAEEIGTAILKYLAQYAIGQDPFDGERIWDEMWQPKLVGRRGITTRIIGGIDIAIWDIKGKATGLPLYKLLGGFTNKIPAYIAGGYYEDDKGLAELALEMEENVSIGATAIKMKIGGVSINEDVERIRVVRETIGPNIKLMVDANCAYRYYEAIEIAKKMEKYDVFWFEEPVNPDDYEGQRLISQATTIPIASGENEYTRYGFRDLIERRSVAILQPDALVMGGITEFMKVVALAQAHDLPIAPHGNQDIHTHLVAAIANGLIVEYYRSSTDPMGGKAFKHTLELQSGHVSPPNRPGIGIELDEVFLEPYKV